MPRSPLLSGARIFLYINGQRFAQVTDFSWASDTPKAELRGIDDPNAQELAHTINSANAQMGLLRTENDGGLEGAQITTQFRNIVREKYFAVTLVDRATDTVLFNSLTCSVVSQRWNVPAKGMVTGTMSIKMIDWDNQADREG